MASRYLNKVTLIGNLTRDPELRYTPQGTAGSQFGLATNRDWTTAQGERKEEVQYHWIVAWSKLAELCSQLLTKGSKVFVEGRIVYRAFEGKDGVQRNITEIVMDNMIVLSGKGMVAKTPEDGSQATEPSITEESPKAPTKKSAQKEPTPKEAEVPTPTEEETKNEEVSDDEIPF